MPFHYVLEYLRFYPDHGNSKQKFFKCDVKCGSDFVSNTLNALKWDYKRATVLQCHICDQSHKNLGEIQCDIFFSFAMKQI